MIFAVLAMAALAAAPPAVSADTASHDVALEFVDRAKIGQNLPVMALAVAKQTVAFTVIAAKVGNDGAIKAVSEEINTLLPQYQPSWNENIAEAYESTFTEDELSSLATKGRSSEYAPKVMAQQGAIAKQIQTKAKPILISLVTQALSAATAKAK